MRPVSFTASSTASPHPSRARVLVSVLILFLTGCGYHRAGSATHISANVRTLAVPIFATHAQAFHTEMLFTQATIRELNTRTKYQIINSDSPDADATFHGTILVWTLIEALLPGQFFTSVSFRQLSFCRRFIQSPCFSPRL